jgi:predicted PurR-regulated permease PerM
MAKARPEADKVTADATLTARFRGQFRFWILTALFLALFLYLFSGILLPFVAGMVLAYFLDPVADRLQRLGLSRFWATIVILFAFIVVLTVALIIVVPIVASQLTGFIGQLPQYLSQLQDLLTSVDPQWLERTFGVDTAALRQGLNSLLSQGVGLITTIFESIWASGMALFNIASLFVVTPVVAFYMLLDWDRMVAKVDSWVPREHVATVRAIAADINTATAGFVRGQGTLCLVLGAYYAIGLTATGLNFGILIGLFVGLISFIPYVGSLVGLVLAVGVAVVQFWPDYFMIGAVALVFFVGQFIEGNILQPRLVGHSVGLHPVWLMFALLAFGALFGFVGLLVAVPASAAIAVLVRFALSRYLQSPLYTGRQGQAPAAAAEPPPAAEAPAAAAVEKRPRPAARSRAARPATKSDASGR